MDVFAKQLVVKQKRKRWGLGIGLGVLAVPLIMLAGLMTTKNGRNAVQGAIDGAVILREVGRARDPQVFFQGHNRLNIVFIGADEDRDNHDRVLNTTGRSDTLMVACFTEEDKSVNIVSIPRDTLAYVPGYGNQKVNAAHSIGGADLVLETLRESFGIQANYYVELKFDGFKKAIDAFGGVDIDVPKDMDYDDKWGNLHIHLKQGIQHLDGAKAHNFVRFRHDKLGDIGRIERQQMLMKALAKQVLSSETLKNLGTLNAKITALRACVNTNLDEDKLLAVAMFMRSVKPDDVHGQMLPGRGGAYWVLDKAASEEILAAALHDTFVPTQFAARVLTVAPKSAGKAGKAKTEEDEPVMTEQEPDRANGARLPPPADSDPDKPVPEPAKPDPGTTPDKPGKIDAGESKNGNQ